jgi:hypothetical protein
MAVTRRAGCRGAREGGRWLSGFAQVRCHGLVLHRCVAFPGEEVCVVWEEAVVHMASPAKLRAEDLMKACQYAYVRQHDTVHAGLEKWWMRHADLPQRRRPPEERSSALKMLDDLLHQPELKQVYKVVRGEMRAAIADGTFVSLVQPFEEIGSRWVESSAAMGGNTPSAAPHSPPHRHRTPRLSGRRTGTSRHPR